MATQQVRVKRSSAAQAEADYATEGASQMPLSQVASSQIDFNQSRLQRLELRQGYRSLRSATAANRGLMLQPTAEGRAALLEAMEESDRLFHHVKMPREGALDAAFLVRTSKLVVEQVERLSAGFRSYDPNKFQTVIRTLLREPGGLVELARKSSAYSLATDPAYFMLGPLDTEVKARVQKERRKKDVIEEEIAPEDVDNLEADQKNESTKRVEVLHEHIKDADQMNFFRFFFDGDPEKGFGRSIENMFYSSFLVRDGHIGIDVRGDQPFAMLQEPPSEQDYVENQVVKHQCVVQLDYPMWLKLCEKYGSGAFLPPPTAEAASELVSQPKTAKKTATAKKAATANGNGIVSPNTKKRQRQASKEEEEEEEEAEPSQIAATPEERMPRSKRAKV